jgi:hypothetical protein
MLIYDRRVNEEDGVTKESGVTTHAFCSLESGKMNKLGGRCYTARALALSDRGDMIGGHLGCDSVH